MLKLTRLEQWYSVTVIILVSLVTIIDERHQTCKLMMETIYLAGAVWSVSVKQG